MDIEFKSQRKNRKLYCLSPGIDFRKSEGGISVTEKHITG